MATLEQTQKNVDQEEAQKLAQKIKSGQDFDLNDYKSQLMQMRKMGGVSAMLDKLPNQMQQMAKASNIDQAEKEMKRAGGIIDSMTPLERRKPDVLKASRKRRIAAGAGVSVQEVNRLLNQYSQMHAMMKKMKGGGLMKMMRTMKGMF